MTLYALVNVWDGETWAYFPTWEEANEYAELVYRETGDPLYIEEVTEG